MPIGRWVLVILASLIVQLFWLKNDDDVLGTMVVLGFVFIAGAIIGGFVAGPQGVATTTFIGFAVMVYVLMGNVTGNVRRSLNNFSDRVFLVSDAHLYSGGVILSLTILRRFTLRAEKFIGFCVTSFLLKRSMNEVEFVHRLLRDYFALRQLTPRLREVGLAKIQAIRCSDIKGKPLLIFWRNLLSKAIRRFEQRPSHLSAEFHRRSPP